MDLPVLVEKTVGFMYLVLGLSFIVRPDFWLEFVEEFYQERVRPHFFVFLALPIGLIIVLAHNQWVWSPSVIVTLFGWSLVLKSILYLLFPYTIIRMLPTKENMRKLLLARGLLLVGLCLVVLYHVYLG